MDSEVFYLYCTPHRRLKKKRSPLASRSDAQRTNAQRAVGPTVAPITIDLMYMVAPIFLFINTSNFKINQNINHIFLPIN